MNNGSYIGRAVRDFELRRLDSGKAVCSFSLAVDRPHKKDTTDFIDFVVFGQGAEYLCQYGHKGSTVSATGPLTSRKWEDKNGNKRINWEVLCDSVSLHDSKKSSDGTFATGNANTDPGEAGGFPETMALISKYQSQGAQHSEFAMLEDDDAGLPF